MAPTTSRAYDLSVSTPGAIFMQTTDDKDISELEMVDKELVVIEELPEG